MDYKSKVNDILTRYGLDFSIEKAPLRAITAAGNEVITPYFALINSKTNEAINTVKAGYGVSQNDELVEMILRGAESFSTELKVTKAGSIHGGRRVFMQMGINGLSKVAGDTIQRFVTIIDSNDGSTSLSVGIGDEWMHCENQFYKFYAAGDAKFRHTATIQEKIKSIPKLIETALIESMRQIQQYKKFESTELTKALANQLVNAVLGYDRSMSKDDLAKMKPRSVDMMDTLYGNIETEVEALGNNMLAAFNGVTRFTTHHTAKPKRDNGGIESMLVGNSYKKNIIALDFCEAHS
jgi:hypothetical protein